MDRNGPCFLFILPQFIAHRPYLVAFSLQSPSTDRRRWHAPEQIIILMADYRRLLSIASQRQARTVRSLR